MNNFIFNNDREFENYLKEVNLKNINKYISKMPKLLISNDTVNKLNNLGYFTAPSSNKKHGAWIGGNFDHSLSITEYLLNYSKENNIKWSREESPYIIGMFHDLCKSNIRIFKLDNANKLKIYKNEDCKDFRHSEKSLDLIVNYLNIDLTIEEKMCIYYHMGEHGEDYEYRVLMEKIGNKYKNIFLTQKADTYYANLGI